jgi:serine/threonine protein kinase
MSHTVHFPINTPREERPSLWSQDWDRLDPREQSKSQSNLIHQLLPFIEPCEAEDAFGAIGSMELLQVIGKGGMGCVCLAYDTFLERRVAIKFLLPHLLEDNTAVARFLREAQTAAAITHPNLMPIYAIGEINSLPYLVMPFVEGGSLEAVLEAGKPLSLEKTIRIARQVATGLAAAHAIGLVHRDIKPGNIMNDEVHDRVIITDFGLARDIEEPSHLTIAGNPLGTPSYFSPEQASGEEADQRSDIYSLGVLLYRMTTGHEPFEGLDNWAMMLQHVAQPPKPPSEHQPEIPAWLNDLILKMMEKQRDLRPRSATEVLQTLSQHDRQGQEAFESARLTALLRMDILDTQTERCFDDLVNLASQLCGTPIALLSLVDKERQWFKAKVGIDAIETHRNLSFCAHAIQQQGPFVVKDATQDARFVDNALVTADPHIRFYAGMPLHSPEGYGIGTLCVIDRTPRELQSDQLQALEALSRLAMTMMEQRQLLRGLGKR